MVKIKKQIVSDDVINKRSYGYGNPVNFITIHQTGNSNAGADAQAHADVQSNLNPRQASWHYQVDDEHVIQSFPENVKCWHASDGQGPGNTQSLAIEICINSDGDYKKAIKNASELVKQLLDKHDLSVNAVKQHNDWYNKNCPAQIRAGKAGIDWDDFIALVQGQEVEPSPENKTKSHTVSDDLLMDGDRGKDVKQLQNRLMELGYDLSTYGADGVYGDETEDAVRAFQSDAGIAEDGIVGPDTRQELDEAEKQNSGKAIVPYPGHLIQRGSRGKDVERIQRAVDEKPDGIYGPKTEAAVKAYQRRHGLTVDGIVGPETWNVMF